MNVMKILVCVKVIKGELNPFDESALECALQLSDDVTVISMGPKSCAESLRPLTRLGAKKAPFYRVIIADSRSPRDGKFIEEIGYYNPLTNPAEVKIDAEKAKTWLKNGAQPTETVKALLKKSGIID